jgi:hypothetical protein
MLTGISHEPAWLDHIVRPQPNNENRSSGLAFGGTTIFG